MPILSAKRCVILLSITIILLSLTPESRTDTTPPKYSRVYSLAIDHNSTYLATDRGLLLRQGEQLSALLQEETFSVAVRGALVLAGTRSGVVLSEDGGKTWRVSSVEDGVVPLAIEFSRKDPARIFIGTDRHGLYRSDDRAGSWQSQSEGLPPSIGASRYAAIKRIAVSPVDDSVYASTDARGVYISRDGGASWNSVPLDLPGAFHHRVSPAIVAFDTTHPESVYILVHFPIHSHLLEHSIHRSTDGGRSWERLKTLEPNQRILDMKVNASIARIVSNKGVEEVDLRLPALKPELPAQQSSPYPGTEPDYDDGDIAILHDDGTLYSFERNDLTDMGGRVAKRFFQRHADQYDLLVTFAESLYPTPTAGFSSFAYNAPIINNTFGLGMTVGVFNGGPQAYGTSGRLKNFVNMNRLLFYPSDPRQPIFLTNSALDLLAHEVGHCWNAFYHFDDAGVTSDELLGRQLAHWSFFFNSDASVMEGNGYSDLGGGIFRTVAATSTYNSLDRYGIGVLSTPASVYFINDPTDFEPDILSNGVPIDPGNPLARTIPPFAPPETESIQVKGTRQNVAFSQIVAVEGNRVPAPSPELGRVSMAFILLCFPGREPDPRDIEKVKRIRNEWVSYFKTATGGVGTAETTLILGGSDTKPPEVTLKNPNGGEVLESGSTIQITWSASDVNGIAKQDIDLSLDGGASYPINIASYLNGKTTSFIYTFPPELFSSNARIRIRSVDYAGNRSEDVSDAPFTLKRETSPPKVTVKSPNGGELAVASRTLSISWASSDNAVLASHDVNLSTDGGRTFPFKLATGLGGNVQEFVWSVPPSLITDSARIEVVARDGAGNIGRDSSDSSFSIVAPDSTPPQVNVTRPVDGEKLQAASTYTLTWKATDNDGLASQEIALSTDGGINFDTVLATGLAANASSFNWRIPDLEITSAKVRVSAIDRQQNRASGQSGVFAITRADVTPPLVRIETPNGGERVRVGEPLHITWEVTDRSSIRSQRLLLSVDGGTSFSTVVAEGAQGGVRSLVFTLPTQLQPTTKARIRVEATDEPGLTGFDTSDADFIIDALDTTPPRVLITSPSGGEVLASDSALQVTWKTEDDSVVAAHEIELSTDGGGTFSTLVSGLAGSVSSQSVDLGGRKGERMRIRVKARDQAGNIGSGSSSDFAVIDRPVIENVEYKGEKRLIITARNVGSSTQVTINDKIFTGIKFKKGQLILKGGRSELGLRSGENFVVLTERGVASLVFRLKV